MTEMIARLKSALSDRYTIEREIGAGGMATVYLAGDVKHNRHVALKVLRPELAAAVGGERFLREIEIAAQIEHPHVLTLIDSGDADGILYYVMPFVKGESLRDRISREEKLPIVDTIRLLRDVADGLAEAHRQGLVHRDVKPDNVLISGRHAVVTDFGVAKAVTSATEAQALTTAGVSLGTPFYMSPEQAGAEPVDHRTDIYALGVMGYELLTGHPPFVGPSTPAVLIAQMTADPEPVTDHRPDTPAALAQLIMKCLAKKPEDRWKTTDEVLQQLEAMATPSGGVPSLRVEAQRLLQGSARRSLVRRALIAAPIVLVIGAFFAVQQRRSASIRELAAQLQPAADSGRLDEVYTTLRAADIPLSARGLGAIAAVVGGRVTLETDPPGALVTLSRVSVTNDTNGISLNTTPIRNHLTVAGDYIAQARLAGYEGLSFMIQVHAGDSVTVRRALVNESWDAEGMVLVEAGFVVGPVSDNYAGQEIPAFLIDRYEVTNEAFMAFVADGGYRDRAFWRDTLQLQEGSVPFETAVETFVDRTGLPGPRTWTGGTFADDRARHPVTGVSWYEAAAYAKWAGGQLPSLAQWWRAALGDVDRPYPWGSDFATLDQRANFSMTVTTPVDRLAAGMSPYGAHDMAGNVREWLAGDPGAERYAAIGGSWQDPSYMFYTPNIDRFAPGFASEAVGFRLVKPVSGR
jgi:formylglycine-generating enzyme required for sulfatase activity